MITFYSFDLYGNLLQTNTSEEMVEVGQNIMRPVPVIQKGTNIELEIDNELLWGIVNKVTYFPPNDEGNKVVYIFIHDLKPKYPSSNKEEK